VEEVFISRKLNRWGNRFGFVRFCDVKNVSRLEAELDSIRIGLMKLYINLPRCRKHEAQSAVHQATKPTNGIRPKKKTNVLKL